MGVRLLPRDRHLRLRGVDEQILRDAWERSHLRDPRTSDW